MNGLKVRWTKGPRTTIESTDRNGKVITRMGKHGGPVIEQDVLKILEPKC